MRRVGGFSSGSAIPYSGWPGSAGAGGTCALPCSSPLSFWRAAAHEGRLPMTLAVRAVFWVIAYLGAVLSPLVFAVIGASRPDHGFWTDFSVALGFVGFGDDGVGVRSRGSLPAAGGAFR